LKGKEDIVAGYNYTAKNLHGEIVRGTYEGSGKTEVMRMLRQKGYFPMLIEQRLESKDVADLGVLNKVTVKDISVFCRQFSTLTAAGLPLLSILELLSKQTMNRSLKKDLLEIAEDVSKGKSFSGSLRTRKNFPILLTSMIEVGETGGMLDSVLSSMATHYEKESKLKQKIKTAMTYPIIVLSVTFIVIFFLLTNVVPVFVGMFEGAGIELPLPTRILLALSTFFVANGIWLVVFVVLFAFVFRFAISRGAGRLLWHKTLFRMPLIGRLISFVLSSSFTRTMAMLLAAGVPLLEAIDMVKKVLSNGVADVALTEVANSVRLGGTFWSSMEQVNLFPLMVTHMIRVGEESGSLDDVLNRTASFFEEESEMLMLKLTTLMEPALILLLAGIVMFVVLSIVLPMFDMMGMIS